MATPTNADEEKLAHALVTRGLVTRDEAGQCRSKDENRTGPGYLLKRLVKNGFLTKSQANRVAQEMSVLLDQQIPGYQLMDKLGQGAMGIVYKARQISMNRIVAVKLLNPRFVGNKEFIDRFTREAHIAAKFSSNNVVQAIDVGSAGPLHYFVMEYVEGTSIKAELEKNKVFSEHEAIDIILQITQALRQAHRRQLIHRDIKPANIMLTPDGIAKLADLGIARETNDKMLARAEKGFAIGTPYYISPEQVVGKEDVDSRADIYSLGATLYHMVTGQPPFLGQKQEVLRAHLKKRLVPPDHINPQLSAGLGEVIELMMAKNRDNRYQTPDDLLIDLECLLAHEPPKIAREKMDLASLQSLAEGEEDDLEELDYDDLDRPSDWQGGVPTIYFVIVLTILGVSLILNLLLFLFRKS